MLNFYALLYTALTFVCGRRAAAVSLLLLFYLVAAADIFTRPWGLAHPHLLTPRREPRPSLGQILYSEFEEELMLSGWMEWC